MNTLRWLLKRAVVDFLCLSFGVWLALGTAWLAGAL